MTRAQCGCGQLSAEISGALDVVVMCHCIACQRRSGSRFGAGAYYPASAVNLTGVSTLYTRAANSGNDFIMRFCPECGSPVWWESNYKPGVIGVAIGAIADPDFPPPQRSVWEQSCHPWVDVSFTDDHFPRGRG